MVYKKTATKKASAALLVCSALTAGMVTFLFSTSESASNKTNPVEFKMVLNYVNSLNPVVVAASDNSSTTTTEEEEDTAPYPGDSDEDRFPSIAGN